MVKFDKGLWYEMGIENMRFFCCQVYMCRIKNLELKLEFTVLVLFDSAVDIHAFIYTK